jgi:hypothetical protein
MILILQIKSCTKESGLATLCRKVFAYIGRWNRSSTPFDTDNVADKGYSNVISGLYQSFITKKNVYQSALRLTTLCREIFDLIASQPLVSRPPNHHHTIAIDCSNISPLQKAFNML